MNEKEFIMWLHGYLEISGATTLGEKELQVIKDHLKEFFVKVTPERHESPSNKYVPSPHPPNWPLVPIKPYVPDYIPPNLDPNRIICQEPTVITDDGIPPPSRRTIC
jgi:hypothetical protein